MSQVILGGLGYATTLGPNDISLMDVGIREDAVLSPVDDEFRDAWWPGAGRLLTGDIAGEYWYEQPEVTRGTNTRYGFVGVTQDRYDTPLGGFTVKLFLTATDALVDTTVSDSLGNYVVFSPYYPDAHYLVTYLAGTPDVAGTSVNTLIGT